ncbi:MAG: universal stress protein, partial [Terriglobia bacterium]
MFKKILVALDHSRADSILLAYVKQLARLTHAEVLLLHVSTGWKAQWQRDLNLSDSQEMYE